jgi:hypothetical protein
MSITTTNVPLTLAEALDPAWLSFALTPLTGGAPITAVETVEIIRTVATKVRFTVAYDGGKAALCLKALLDVDQQMARGGAVTVLEANFYEKLAPRLSIRRPPCVATVIDREAQFGIVIMRDLIAAGNRFCSALEPFSADEAASSLAQLALLHEASNLLDELPWVKPRIGDFVRNAYVPQPLLQEMLNGARGEGLSTRTRDAGLLLKALEALAEHDAAWPHFLVHGDSHAGNIYRTPEGPGLIDWQLLQRGGWALDAAYHIAAVLPVELAEREERRLLLHYLETMRGLGMAMPGEEEAWAAYRIALVYGYYLWAITRRVDPPITNLFVNRLGSAVERHGSFGLLGV